MILELSPGLQIPLIFKAFGQLIQLNLRRNDKIVSSQFQVWKHNAKGVTEELSQLNAPDLRYYLHKDHMASAAISFNRQRGLVLFLEKNLSCEKSSLYSLLFPFSRFYMKTCNMHLQCVTRNAFYKRNNYLLEVAWPGLFGERYTGDHTAAKRLCTVILAAGRPLR